MAVMTALVALAAPRSTAARLLVLPAAWVVQELDPDLRLLGLPLGARLLPARPLARS